VILLMAPAAFHRITFQGESTEAFHALGSGLVLAAAVPLALGIVLEMHVAVSWALENATIGMAAALLVAAMLAGLWLVAPLVLRGCQGAVP